MPYKTFDKKTGVATLGLMVATAVVSVPTSGCSSDSVGTDAGVGSDASMQSEAGADAVVATVADASVPSDAAAKMDAVSPPDATIPPDAVGADIYPDGVRG